MNGFNSILSFLKYFVKAKTIHGIHSPFLYAFLSNTFDQQSNFYAFEDIEKLRGALKKNGDIIHLTDFGAGSRKGNPKKKKVCQILKDAVSPPRQCQAMFRMLNFEKAKNILELGTSLGISTLYLAADPTRRVTAMDGDPALIKIAQGLAEDLHYSNIDFIEGPFTKTLPSIVEKGIQMDAIFMDGHHAEQPTLAYFEMLQPLIHNDTLIIVDDIHWSDGMESAWEKLKQNDRVMQSIDVYYFGLLFFRKEFLNKEHHVFKYI